MIINPKLGNHVLKPYGLKQEEARISEQIKELLSKAYEIKGIKSIETVENSLDPRYKTLNDVYIIDKKYVLKVYRNRYHDKERYFNNVISIKEVINHLKPEISVPNIISNKIVGLNEKVGFLFDYINTKNKKERPNLPKIIARYHIQIKEYKNKLPIRILKESLEHTLKEIKENAEIMFHTDIIKKNIKILEKFLSRYEQFEQIIIHGDFAYDNLINETIIDFDNIMYGPKLYDIATPLVYALFSETDKEKIKQIIQDFITKYKKEDKLSKIEEENIIPAIRFEILRKLIDQDKWKKQHEEDHAIKLLELLPY